MRYFNPEMIQGDDYERINRVFDEANESYLRHQQSESHRWSRATRDFVETIERCVEFHDLSIESILIDIVRAVIEIRGEFGSILLKQVADFKCDIEIDPDFDDGVKSLNHEVVAPRERKVRSGGFVEFNLLTEYGELSITAKDVVYSKKPKAS